MHVIHIPLVRRYDIRRVLYLHEITNMNSVQRGR